MQTGPQPADFADVRATNLAVVLRYVRAHAPCSRADIAASTGLNKATVSSLVADLIDRRLLRETGLAENRIGRPATMLVLDGSAYAAIGLEVTADHLTAVAIDLAGEQLLHWRRSFAGLTPAPPTARFPAVTSGASATRHDSSPTPATAPTAGKAISAITALANRAVARVTGHGRQVLGLTVGVPGLVDQDGRVRLAPSLGWADVDLRGDLIRALRAPGYDVAVENDANLSALAEQRYGGHSGSANLVYLTGEVGIGAGLIVDGRLLHGGRGFTGEIGHIPLELSGARGARGSLQELASIESLIHRVLPDADADGPLTDFAPEVDRLAGLARQGQKRALDALSDVGRHLGHGLSLVTNLVNPEVIILGGYFRPLAQWLIPAAEAELSARTLAPDAGGARIVPSTVGSGAAAVGGAARALEGVDAGQLPQLTMASSR